MRHTHGQLTTGALRQLRRHTPAIRHRRGRGLRLSHCPGGKASVRAVGVGQADHAIDGQLQPGTDLERDRNMGPRPGHDVDGRFDTKPRQGAVTAQAGFENLWLGIAAQADDEGVGPGSVLFAIDRSRAGEIGRIDPRLKGPCGTAGQWSDRLRPTDEDIIAVSVERRGISGVGRLRRRG